jgi:hypothetical protein
MKSVLAWLAVNAFFVALGVSFAATFFGLAKLGNAIVPALMNEPLFLYPLGLIALGATLALAYKAMQFIGGSSSRDRVRGRG